MINRIEINRALAKAIAFKQCGKQAEAERWAERLIILLECANILGDEFANEEPEMEEVLW